MRWTLKPKPDSKKTANLATKLGVDKAIAELLLQRGIESFEDAKTFFRPSWSDLHDPFLMKDMDKAVVEFVHGLVRYTLFVVVLILPIYQPMVTAILFQQEQLSLGILLQLAIQLVRFQGALHKHLLKLG